MLAEIINWMQVAVFILQDIIPSEQLLVWELLSEV